jgi:two-component system, sensor histidine kinase PhcS
MSLTDLHIDQSAFNDAYGKADASLRVRQSKLYLILTLVLVPAYVGLDYVVYPSLWHQIFIGRLLCDVAQLPCLALLYSQWGKRHVVLLSKYPPLAPCITICWMIYASEGVISPYYAGINLVLVGVCLLIPYTLGEAGVISGVVVVCYSLACLFHKIAPPMGDIQSVSAIHGFSSFVNNIYFLAATAVISLAACHYASRRRLEEFRLQYELDVNNRELAATLAKLQETEVQLVQSEKMNALGKLSAGLLHEINNPLNFTFMALQIAKQDCRDNAEMTETLNDIGEGMTRIKTVIADLRAFAYPSHHSERTPVPIEDALNSALRLTTHELGTIKVEREGIEGAKALGSSTQLAHVLMNLLVNSAHAIKTAKREKDATIKVSCTQIEGFVRIAVRDNGCGVEAANLSKLMDPFFTTKAPGEGMGLGLSICHTIVKNHGGTIRIESQPGEWTQVSVDLPAPVSVRSAA